MIFSCLQLGCRKEKSCLTCTSSATSCDYPPGNRNFTWRLDTVAWWPSEVGGVWAFSDNDAWVMGNMHGPTVPGQTNYVGMHWDGESWQAKISFTDVLVMPNDVAGDNHFIVAAGYAIFPQGTIPSIAEFDNNTKKWTGYQFQTLGTLYSVWTDGNGYFIAVGDNGMVYTKDGYTANWVYTKAPTNFTFYHINGVSKNEVYASAYLSLTSGQDYEQYWKFDGSTWYKLFDNQDTTGNIISLPGDYSGLTDVAAYRCSVTDSLRLYLGGWDSFLLQSKGQSLSFSALSLSTIGLPLHSLGRYCCENRSLFTQRCLDIQFKI